MWPDTSNTREKVLRYSHGRVVHTILGTAVSWKVFKLSVILYSTDAEVRMYLIVIKCTKQFRLFLEHLELSYGSSIPLYQDNTAVIILVKANKITNRLRHIDIPLCYMHNKYNLQTFSIGHCQSNAMLSNFLMKLLSSIALLRKSSFAIEHIYLAGISQEHFKKLNA